MEAVFHFVLNVHSFAQLISLNWFFVRSASTFVASFSILGGQYFFKINECGSSFCCHRPLSCLTDFVLLNQHIGSIVFYSQFTIFAESLETVLHFVVTVHSAAGLIENGRPLLNNRKNVDEKPVNC